MSRRYPFLLNAVLIFFCENDDITFSNLSETWAEFLYRSAIKLTMINHVAKQKSVGLMALDVKLRRTT